MRLCRVNTVEKRAGDPFLVFGHDRWRTGAGFLGIAIEPKWTGIHRSDQLGIYRES